MNQPLYYRLTKDELKLYKLFIEYRDNFKRIRNLIRDRQDFMPALQEVIDAINHQL